MADVGRIAGVSPMTVSRALRNSPLVTRWCARIFIELAGESMDID